MIHPPYMLHHAGISPIIHLYEIMKYEMMKWMRGEPSRRSTLGDRPLCEIKDITFGSDSRYAPTRGLSPVSSAPTLSGERGIVPLTPL